MHDFHACDHAILFDAQSIHLSRYAKPGDLKGVMCFFQWLW